MALYLEQIYIRKLHNKDLFLHLFIRHIIGGFLFPCQMYSVQKRTRHSSSLFYIHFDNVV